MKQNFALRLGCMSLFTLLGIGTVACGKKRVESTSVELTTQLSGVVKGGRGAGVVGGPIQGVEVTVEQDNKRVGPVSTDASGSFTLDLLTFCPSGTQNTTASLTGMAPISVTVRFEKPQFKTHVETVTIPFTLGDELEFPLSGEAQ